MGRQVRRVPADWEHPTYTEANKGPYNHIGQFIPMFDQDYESRAEEWLTNLDMWRKGEHEDQKDGSCADYKYMWEWSGDPPGRESYRERVWTDAEATHYQMYEDVSEGTPISPVMESPEALARWLVDNNGNAGGGETASYEQWLRVCNGGYAPSLVMNNGVLSTGVNADLPYK